MKTISNLPPGKETGTRLKIPHVFALLFMIVIAAALTTYIVPSGEYERMQTEDGRTIVVDGTYVETEADPAGFWDVFQAVHAGMVAAADIIFYIFIVGGAFGILRASGTVEAMVGSISLKMKGRENLLIPVLMTLFSLSGAMLGLAEETMPYITIMVPLALMLGYDSMVGTAIVLLGTASGFTAAFMNPFTLGVAQGIAELPIFSGLGLRVIFWVIYLGLSIAFVMRYAAKVKKSPALSTLYETDLQRSYHHEPTRELKTLSQRQQWALVILAASMLALAYGVISQGWFTKEISGLFLLMGIVIGFVCRMTINEIAESFIEGCKVIVIGALVVGVAHGILVVLQEGKIMDTILYGLSQAVGSLPTSFAAIGMYITQCFMNYLVPSGSGQAALTMPIMAPLSDLVGVSRQTAVLAYQFGDGISNIFTPTSGYFMAGLALAGISWIQWAKWIWPLIVAQYILGAIFITFAHLIGY